MNVADMERRFFELKGRLDLGTINEGEFKAELEKLRFEDKQGRWWMIGAQSGKWYMFDGVRWLPAQVPVDVEPKTVQAQPSPRDPIVAKYDEPKPIVSPLPQEPNPVTPKSTTNGLHFEPIVSEPAHDEFTVEPPSGDQTPAPPPAILEPAPTPKQDQVFVSPFTPNTLITPAPLFSSEPSTPTVPPTTATPPAKVETQPATVPPPSVEHLPPLAPSNSIPEHIAATPQKKISRPSARPARGTRSSFTVPKLPVSPPVFIGLAALFAIVAVVIFWIAFDNLVPGKPISQLFGLPANPTPRPGIFSTPVAQSSALREVGPILAMGDQLLTQSNIDVAITQYQNALQLAPNNAAALTHLSRALAYKGDLPNALKYAQQAVQATPNDSDANAQFCRMLAWNGQTAEAVVACDGAMRADPKNGTTRTALVEAYLFSNRLPDAQAQLPNALQLASQSAETYRVQAWLLTLQGQRPAALDAWRQTVQLEPDFYFRHFEFAEVLRVVYNAPGDAIPEYKKSISLYGGYTPAVGKLGIALVTANQSQEAINTLRRAITLDPKNAEYYAYLGVAYGKTNQCAQAIPYFEEALKIDPGNSMAQKGAADCKAGKEPIAPPPTPPTIPLVPPSSVK